MTDDRTLAQEVEARPRGEHALENANGTFCEGAALLFCVPPASAALARPPLHLTPPDCPARGGKRKKGLHREACYGIMRAHFIQVMYWNRTDLRVG